MEVLWQSTGRYICHSCLRNQRNRRPGLQNSPRISSPRSHRQKSHIARPGEQANPITGFYAELLSSPLPVSGTRNPPAPAPATQLPTTEEEEKLRKTRLVFGSRLAGPIDRRTAIEKASRDIAGVMVPPRPKEPDNCCMSGCVNCVWDVYRDELEEWASRSAEARAKITAQRAAVAESANAGGGSQPAAGMPAHVASSMDDDGGGSETNWESGLEMSGEQGDLFEGIPVGIREFMKTEKLLKMQHQERKGMEAGR